MGLQVLLKARAEVDHVDATSGDTAISIAAKFGGTRAMQALVDARADLSAGGPVYEAAHGGNADCLSLLLNGNADIDQRKGNKGNPALYASAENGHKETV